jgi:hypothetical protein
LQAIHGAMFIAEMRAEALGVLFRDDFFPRRSGLQGRRPLARKVVG